jgi:hypothetical protein
MSKFDELTTLAIKCRDGFHEMQQEITGFARLLVKGWRTYLGDPGLAVYCQEVDRSGNVIGNQKWQPEPCFCLDTFWYFDLGMQFPSPTPPGWAYSVQTRIGLKQIGDDYVIKHGDEGQYHVREDNIEQGFYEPFFQEISKLLERSWTEERRSRFGFSVPTRELA